jgi:hypothetical protein
MRSRAVIILQEQLQMPTQRQLVEDDHMSRHSRRIVPMTRSMYARCGGARGAPSTS